MTFNSKLNPRLRLFHSQTVTKVFLVLGITAFTPGLAHAQWSTNGNNISNTNSGNVGIGMSTPIYKLDVNGATNGFRAKAATVSSNDAVATFENTNGIQFIVRGDGNVGIGTASPQRKLHVHSTANTVFQITDNTSGSTTGDGFQFTQAGLNTYLENQEAGSMIFRTSALDRVWINSTGSVGIGTGSPAHLLHVNSVATPAASQFRLTANGLGGLSGLAYAADNIQIGFDADWSNNAWLARNASAARIIKNGGKLSFAGNIGLTVGSGFTPTDRLTIDLSNGNVGIGNTSPAYRLHVDGEINATGFRINGMPISNGPGAMSSVFGRTGEVVAATNDYTWAQINKSTSSLGDLTTRSAGDLNAGTVPIGRLGASGTANSTTFLRGDNTWAAVPGGPSQWTTTSGTNNISYNTGNVGIGTTTPSYSFDVNGGVNSFRAKAATVSSNDLIATFENASGIQAIVRGNGNVGMGITNPSEKLEVVGNIKVTGTGNIDASGTITGGNIVAKFQDLAEWVESSQELPAGTVVVVDHTRSNQVIASSQAYDTRVAGVISVQPGIALGERGDNKVLVATTGRVRLKVDVSSSAIEVGDLLVTSDIPGVAMKSQPVNLGGIQLHRPGTLVGKALEPLTKGRGEILVLLSLQ